MKKLVGYENTINKIIRVLNNEKNIKKRWLILRIRKYLTLLF
ncbi:hypothetical protein HMPREF0497_0963 [Lentilactobacillus buchneri ATCC 11577]|nr:hypothetical protein HMPREF0497_0963 [Lentilactobacillus buchneri ATCC 11577]